MHNLRQITTSPSLIPGRGNHLIDRLPREERRKVRALCVPVDLDHGALLCEPDQPYEYAYFPLSGCISLVKTLGSHEPMETVLIGCEGMLGATMVLGVPHAPLAGRVQSHSLALRMKAADFQLAIETCPALVRTLKCYLFVVMVNLAQTAACTRFHDVGSRLARGLLMANDRARSNQFQLTHQVLADMLGVQRGAVTIAAGHLQKRKIIHYIRGKITILNRMALEAESCECYEAETKDYAQLLS